MAGILAGCASSSPARAGRSAPISRSGSSPRAHDVFGVDKRLNTWTDDFRYLLQDLSGHYAAMEGGVGGIEYPPADVVVHLAATPRCTSSSASPRGRSRT